MSLVAQRLSAQGLSGRPATSVVQVVDRLLAVQAQDPRGARLAIRARSTGLHASDVDSALNERSVVITWLNRGTLHLVRSDDYWWMQALTTPPLFTASARRLAQEGVQPAVADKGVALIERALVRDGPLTRGELRERVARGGVRVEGQALVHLLLLASLRGLIVRGPMKGNEQGLVLVRDWLGTPKTVDREQALAQLVRRYLIGHGPAHERDLAKWAGLPIRDVRQGLASNAAGLRETNGLVDLRGQRRSTRLPPPRLLGAFDPLLLGWASRAHVLDDEHKSVVTDNGVFRAFALVDGRAVATWSLVKNRVRLAPFTAVSPADATALDRDAADVHRFLLG